MENNSDLELCDYQCVCFHGHTKEVIDNIIETKSFNDSIKDWEWLGDGVYFFERHFNHAKNWCIKARKYDKWSTVEANITTEKMLDMIDPDNFDEFKKITSKIRNRYSQSGGIKKVTTKLIFNLVHIVENYDAVRHSFSVGEHEECIYPTNMVKMGIQICVRNHDCIDILKEVGMNGC